MVKLLALVTAMGGASLPHTVQHSATMRNLTRSARRAALCATMSAQQVEDWNDTHTDTVCLRAREFTALVTASAAVDARAQLVTLLGGDAGLRLGEILALEQDDVDYKRNVIRVEGSERRGQVTTPKSGKARQVPMTKRLHAALQAARRLPAGGRILLPDPQSGQPARRPPRGSPGMTW
jgi:site-specific recombinase XerD